MGFIVQYVVNIQITRGNTNGMISRQDLQLDGKNKTLMIILSRLNI